MPVLSDAERVPSYRRHKPTGQAVVTLNGRDRYLGKWNTKSSRAEYDRLIGEWLAGGRLLAHEDAGLTVAELAAQFWRHAKVYYRKDGPPTAEVAGIRVALRVLRTTYANTLVAEFGPLALKALQQKMIDLGHSRVYVNANIHRIRRMFRWGVAEEKGATRPGGRPWFAQRPHGCKGKQIRSAQSTTPWSRPRCLSCRRSSLTWSSSNG